MSLLTPDAVAKLDGLVPKLVDAISTLVDAVTEPAAIEAATLSQRASALTAVGRAMTIVAAQRARTADSDDVEEIIYLNIPDSYLQDPPPSTVGESFGQSAVPLDQHRQFHSGDLPILDHDPAVDDRKVSAVWGSEEERRNWVDMRAAHWERIEAERDQIGGHAGGHGADVVAAKH
jgi:hypothetical protein